ncbi:Fur family transcriptional regulator [Streptomyces sp. NPDC051684]|uniref:Fur family transcriptional regulator n=1 Tax=Streptomyces sp. NPDC051684 TaxID=3365670 RepID=UPI0037BAFF4E
MGGRVIGRSPGDVAGTAVPSPSVLLRGHGLRATSNRRRILDLLGARDAHLSAAEVHDALHRSGERVDPATVYRTLEVLTEVSLAHAVDGSGPKRYGGGSEPHHHAVCRGCGAVKDLPLGGLAEATRHIEELTGLRPDASGALLFHGLCGACSV